jgi:hypothetical protein
MRLRLGWLSIDLNRRTGALRGWRGAIIEPSDVLSIDPFSLHFLPLRRDIEASSMLFPVLPVALVLSFVRPCENTITVFLIILIIALIGPSVIPGKDSKAIHIVILPGSRVLPSVKPSVNALSFYDIVLELTNVFRLISPYESALTVLESILILALIRSPVV